MEGQGREKKRPPRRGEPARLQVEGSPHSASSMQKGTTPRGAAGVDTSSPLPQHRSPSTSSSQRARASRLRTVPRRERGGRRGGAERPHSSCYRPQCPPGPAPVRSSEPGEVRGAPGTPSPSPPPPGASGLRGTGLGRRMRRSGSGGEKSCVLLSGT